MEIGQIIKGHLNEILGLNKDISVGRIAICKECPLYSPVFGGVCNNKIYFNPETGDVKSTKEEGYINGCGCRLLAKTKLVNATCPLNKW